MRRGGELGAALGAFVNRTRAAAERATDAEIDQAIGLVKRWRA